MERRELKDVVYEKDGPIARIILDNPDKANMQTEDMVWSVNECLDDAQYDYDIKVVIIKANGCSSKTCCIANFQSIKNGCLHLIYWNLKISIIVSRKTMHCHFKHNGTVYTRHIYIFKVENIFNRIHEISNRYRRRSS